MIENIKNSNNSLTFLILFIVYSVIMIFLFPIKTIGFFISYIFTVIFLIIAYLIIKYIDKNYPENNTYLYTFTYMMLFIQMILSIILSVFNIFFNITIIVNVLFLALFIIITVLLLRSTDYIEEVQEETERKTEFIKKIKEELEIIEVKYKNDSINFNGLKDKIRFSNQVSNEKSFEIEKEILDKFSNLKMLINENSDKKDIESVIKNIEEKLEERNVLLKYK